MERIRVIYSKSKDAAFLDSKDLICVFENSLKRAKISFCYKDNMPDFTFIYPLSVGIESVNEFIEIKIQERLQISYFIKELNKNLPSGITCLGAEYVDINSKSMEEMVVASVYIINFVYDNEILNAMTKREIEVYKMSNIKKLKEYLSQENVFISRKNGENTEEIDIKNNIKDINILIDDSLELTLDTGIRGNVDPNEIMLGFIKYLGRNIDFNIKRIKILYK